ncbi:hypothetical protein [Yoonia sp. 208BN28-4]|uniref:hypothetical protein n=1 Tax=Yoonia sp. 208BN28-4 TaxID=3126505 RepID=UPI003098DF07
MSKFFEAVGMISVGAVAAGGMMWFVTLPPEEATVTPAAFAPTQQPAVFTADQPAPAIEVTRAAGTAVQLGAADRIHAIIQQTDDSIDSQEPLTPEQQEVVAFFEKIARDRNAQGGTQDATINFDNLTIERLNVKYYYSTAADYRDVDVPGLMAEQRQLVQSNICNQTSIRTLIAEYDLEYTYRFLSNDFRYIGEVVGDVAACPN